MRRTILLVALALQALVIIWLEVRISILQSAVKEDEQALRIITDILGHHDQSLKDIALMECAQEHINAIFNAGINGSKPNYRPFVVSESCYESAH